MWDGVDGAGRAVSHRPIGSGRSEGSAGEDGDEREGAEGSGTGRAGWRRPRGASTVTPDPVLSGLYVYPLKSAAGIGLERASLERRGISGDRRWMVVDPEGTFLSQRGHPRLALVRAEPVDGGLRLSAPDRPSLSVATPESSADPWTVTVWGDAVRAAPAAPEADAWLSAHLGTAVRLVHMPATSHRPVDPAYAVHEDDEVTFVDGYPVLLTSEASLADLDARMAAPLPMDRFRPSLVVSGAPAWSEDRWRRIRIGQAVLRLVKPCGRCVTTTVDQQTAARGKEPLATLAGFRRHPETGTACFGWNAIPERTGSLAVGAPVEVLDVGRPPDFGAA